MASTLKINNLDTASGTTITIPTGKKLIGTDSATMKQPGMILQTINATTNTEFQFSSANSWVDTGLFSMTFPNALQSGSKVLCTIYATLGEAFDNSWGSRTMISIFENTTNKGDATYGVVNGNAQMTGNASYTQYECNRLVGSILFTPSVTNGTYKLYANQKGAGAKYIGGVQNTDAGVPQGATQLTLQEIAQ